MRKLVLELPARLTTLLAAGVLGLLPVCFSAPVSTNEILAAYQESGHYTELAILYPGNETVFPPEIAPARSRGEKAAGRRIRDLSSWSLPMIVGSWLFRISTRNGRPRRRNGRPSSSGPGERPQRSPCWVFNTTPRRTFCLAARFVSAPPRTKWARRYSTAGRTCPLRKPSKT